MSDRPPTPAMLRVLRRMADGWELGSTTGLDGGNWIQEGGRGAGNWPEKIHGNTAHGLRIRGLIRWNFGDEMMTADLTAKGRELVDAMPKTETETVEAWLVIDDKGRTAVSGGDQASKEQHLEWCTDGLLDAPAVHRVHRVLIPKPLAAAGEGEDLAGEVEE